jgi:hypothetical protein
MLLVWGTKVLIDSSHPLRSQANDLPHDVPGVSARFFLTGRVHTTPG